MLSNEQETAILKELKVNFAYDLDKVISNMLKKSSLDIKNKIVEILGIENPEQIKEAKQFVNDATEVYIEEIKTVTKNYFEQK